MSQAEGGANTDPAMERDTEYLRQWECSMVWSGVGGGQVAEDLAFALGEKGATLGRGSE